jgi:serine/threonine protein kinase
MTLYDNFAPSNIFESFLKAKLLIDEGHPETCEHIEILYRQIYYDSDDSELIINKFLQINQLIDDILTIYQEDPSSLQHFKNDIAVVYVFKNIAIKIYKLSTILNSGHDKLYQLLLKNECPNLEHIYRAFQIEALGIYVVVSQVVDVTTFKHDLNTTQSIIRLHTNNALSYLHTNGWIHRDVSIDNLGFNSEINNFILFDFGLTKFSSLDDELDKGFYTDMNHLDRSIKYHIENSE